MPTPSTGPRRELTLLDAASIIVGIIVGAGIYKTTPLVAMNAPGGVWGLLGVWFAGGLFALVGAVCYAELATAWPHAGGDFDYLERAFGRQASFFFGWTASWVVRPGAIGAMALVFAEYAQQLFPLAEEPKSRLPFIAWSILAVLFSTAINALGVKPGKWFQNLLTGVKVLGLVAIFLAAIVAPAKDVQRDPTAVSASDAAPTAQDDSGKPANDSEPASNLGLAMILVLFTYGGWNEMAFVAAEIAEPRKNLLRALLLGTGAVMAIYLLVNLAFIHSLGLNGLRSSSAVAASAVAGVGGSWPGKAVSALICVSSLGAIHGQIFTGGRMFYALGRQHLAYRPLGKWNDHFGAPIRGLVAQGVVSVAFLLYLGRSEDAFEKMNILCATPVWLVMLLVALALLALRQTCPDVERPVRVPLYPLTPLVFAGMSLFMLHSSLAHAANQEFAKEILYPLALITLAGLVLCIVLGRDEKGQDA